MAELDAGTIEGALVMRDLASSVIDRVNKALATYDRKLDEVVSSTKKASKANDDAFVKMEKIGGLAGRVGLAMSVGVTLPVLAAGAAALKFGSDFEKSMKQLEVLSGVATDTVQEFKQQILELGPAMGKGPEELAQAMLKVTSTGMRGAEAMDVLTVAAKGSAVGLGDTSQVADALTSVINAYGKENLSAARAGDILFKSVLEGKAEASELAGVLGRVVGIASQVGVSFEEVGAFVATFTRLGVDAAEATTSLRGVMSTLLQPTKEARAALIEAGTSVEELKRSVKEKGLTQAMGDLLTAMKGNEEGVAAVFGNVRALAGVMGTAGAQGADFQKVIKSITNSTGDLDKGFKETTKTSDFAMKQLRAELEKTGVILGATLAPMATKVLTALQPVIRTLGDMAGGFGKLPDAAQIGLGSIAALVVAGGPLLLGLSAVVTAVKNIREGLILLQGLSVIKWLAGLSAAALGTAAAIGGLVLGIAGLIGLGIKTQREGERQAETLRQQGLAAGYAKLQQMGLAEQTDKGAKVIKFSADQLKEVVLYQQQHGQSTKAAAAETLKGTAALEKAKASLAALDAQTRKNIAADLELGGSAADVAAKYNLSAGVVELYKKSLEGAKGATTSMREEQELLFKAQQDAIGVWQENIAAIRAYSAEASKASQVKFFEDASAKIALTSTANLKALETINEANAQTDDLQKKRILSGVAYEIDAIKKRGDAAKAENLARMQYMGQSWDLTLAAEKAIDQATATGIESVLLQTDNAKQAFAAMSAAFAMMPGMAGLSAMFDDMSKDAEKAGEDAAKSFAAGWKSFKKEIGQALADSFVAAVQGGGNIGEALAGTLGTQLMKSFEGSSSTRGKIAAGIGAGIVAGMQGAKATVQAESKTMGALAGAASGAAMGASIAGPWGAAIGGAMGLLGGLFGDSTKKARDLRKELIANAGGLKELQKAADYAGFSLNKFLNAKKESAVKAEMQALEAAVKATQERLAKLGTDLDAIVSRGGLVSPDMLRRLMADAGKDEVKALLADLQTSETNRAIGGLSAFIGTRQTTIDGLKAAQDAVAGLRKERDELLASGELGIDDTKALADITKALTDAEKKANDLGGALAAMPLNANNAAAFGASLAVMFESLTSQGASPIDALKAMGPAIDQLSSQLSAAGLSGGPAFAEIARLAAMAADTIAGPAIAAVSGLGDALTGMQNLGLLSQDTFSGLAGTVYEAFHALELQGKGGVDAARLMQKPLQTIWELQQDFGYEVDASTQALLDFAQTSGLVGDKFRPAQDQMVRALDGLTSRLGDLVKLLSDGIAGAAQRGAAGIEAAYQNPFDIRYRYVVEGTAPDGGGVDGSFASGTRVAGGGIGFYDFGRESIVAVHGEEAIVPKSAVDMAGGAGPGWGGRGAGSEDRDIHVTLMMPNGDVLLQEVVKAGKDRGYF